MKSWKQGRTKTRFRKSQRWTMPEFEEEVRSRLVILLLFHPVDSSLFGVLLPPYPRRFEGSGGGRGFFSR